MFFGLLSSSQLWLWATSIGSSILMVVGMQPEPNPYEDIGFVCIALVFGYVVFHACRQSYRLIVAIKSRKEE